MVTACWLLLCASLSAQSQIAKLLSSDLAQGDQLGSAVAIDGDWLLVGAPLHDEIASQSGAVYVYRRTNGTWAQVQKLKAADASFGANFGTAVAIDSARAVVSAPGDSPQGILAAGSAYIFELVGTTWVEQAKVWASDAASQVFCAQAVAISGNRVVLGSMNASPAGWLSGEAYVFEGSGPSWTQVAQLIGSDTVAGDAFGTSVAIAGDRVVIGAPRADLPPPGWDAGAAYVFERSVPGGWVQSMKLTSSDGLHSDFFGFVAVWGDRILVGAPGRNESGPDSGAAYFFERQGTTWAQTQKVVGTDTDAIDQFGTWLAIRGDLAAITSASDTEAGLNTGSAYAFQRTSSGWIQLGKLLANDAGAHDLFGFSVGVSGNTIAVGSPRNDDACAQVPTCDSGSSYLFEVVPTAVQYGSCATGAPCGNPDAHGGCRNSTGAGAMLAVGGSASVAADDLILEVRHLPPGTSGLLYMGGGQTSTPFGDGRRVVSSGGAGMFRLGIQPANAEGVMTRGPGLVAQSQGFPGAGHIAAGQSWNFQCWYRNTAGPCGAHFNLSNGVSVEFSP